MVRVYIKIELSRGILVFKEQLLLPTSVLRRLLLIHTPSSSPALVATEEGGQRLISDTCVRADGGAQWPALVG